ncbi:MAG: hypothetical protein GWO07_08345 [Candidatus Dadabacteria bacterium]|nr:hypothetical protein [Candidatus Dadabacteria bacterium]NIS08755.1 hypothetical protein [Candidatus Dadabacteria bacterium]NIV42698.1 hypothetical protein [Candidatus Dadabacteria bacterium]NIX15441.1 hypothetical protein [Candidatus Dadabacteria bacterium]NIY22103.1 hypothetical protein [Candidatus Dadabacteria bacterium]
MSGLKLILTALALLNITLSNYAVSEDIPNPVKTAIYTTNTKPEAGEVIQVGVQFRLDPDWHIYWKNPGDSGLPTRVNYTVPKGFELKETYYPLPKTFLREGNILDYGYEDELLLISDIKVPDDYDKRSFKISSEATWVVCREVCIPGSENLDMEFPIKDKRYAADRSLFDRWVLQNPKKVADDMLPFKYSVKKEFGDNEKVKYVDITLNWKYEVYDIEIFPDVDKSVYMKDIKLANGKNISSYSFSPVIFNKDRKDLDDLDIVVSYKDGDGNRVGIETTLNLDI